MDGSEAKAFLLTKLNKQLYSKNTPKGLPKNHLPGEIPHIQQVKRIQLPASYPPKESGINVRATLILPVQDLGVPACAGISFYSQEPAHEEFFSKLFPGSVLSPGEDYVWGPSSLCLDSAAVVWQPRSLCNGPSAVVNLGRKLK